MLTLKFKAYPTSEQKLIIEKLLRHQKLVWNLGLAALEEFDQFLRGYKSTTGSAGDQSGGYAPCCPIPWRYRRYYLTEKGEITSADNKKAKPYDAPYSPLLDKISNRAVLSQFERYKNVTTAVSVADNTVFTSAGLNFVWGWKGEGNCTGYCCPIPINYRPPLIESPKFTGKGGLGQVIKAENIPEKYQFLVKFGGYKWRAGTMWALSTAWEEYNKSRKGLSKGPKRGKPHYKKRADGMTTLIHPNPKGVIEPSDNHTLVGLPLIGKLRVSSLDRWRSLNGEIPPIALFKICQRPSGYYVQLTGDLPREIPKPSTKALGIDPGVKFLATLDNGKRYENPRYFKRVEKAIAKLKRELSKKQIAYLLLWLNDAGRSVDHVMAKARISRDRATRLLASKPKTAKAVLESITASQMESLKFALVSNRQEKLKQKIARLEEKVKLQRRSYYHKISSYIVRTAGAIAIEDGMQAQEFRAKCAAIENETQSGFEANGKEKRTQHNKSLSDTAPGMLISMIEEKAKAAGRSFKRIDAPYTTMDCPVCNHRQDWEWNNKRVIKCEQCHYELDWDQRAAILILSKAEFNGFTHSLPYQDARERSSLWHETHAKPAKQRKQRKTKQKAS